MVKARACQASICDPPGLLARFQFVVLSSAIHGPSRMRLTFAIVLILALTTSAGAAEVVGVGEGPGALNAVLYRPKGPGPFPVVVGLHGCAGLLGSNGNVRESRVRSSRERVNDAYLARRWLQSQSWTVKNRVSVMGWSSGAIASLWAVRPRAMPHDGHADFRSAVAFYPGCRRLGSVAWSARVPTLILIGRADDWTPAAPCEQMVAGARGRTAQATIVVYPGAYHEFDRPDAAVHALSGLAYSADGTGRAHAGTNPPARGDAIRRVTQWLLR